LCGVFEVVEACSEEEFRALWLPRGFDLLLLDMRLRRDREGLDVLREVFAQDELQPVIMVSAYGDTESAIAAVGAGAMMFLHKSEFTLF
jgi:DNA-binding NtrC family response regulator